MKALTASLCSALALLALATRPAGAADTVYAANFLAGSKQVVSYPVGAPQSMTLIGPQPDTLAGMDFDPGASQLRAINFTTQSLGTLSLASGAFTPGVALQGGCCITAFTVDPVDGTLLVSRGDHMVHELNPSTGATVALGVGVPAGGAIGALAMSCSGELVAADNSTGSAVLYRSDLQTPVLIGVTGAGPATSLEFDNPTGSLYAWFNAAGADTSTHAQVSLANAQLSGQSSWSGRYRMAIDNVCTAAQLRLFQDGFEG
jgi:hypothetical protein